MCDEKLDDSNEALLSRIATLEEKLAAGAFVNASALSDAKPQDTAKDTAKAAESAKPDKNTSGTDGDVLLEIPSSTPVKETKQESNIGEGKEKMKETTDTVPENSKPAIESDEKQIDAWADVVSRIRKTDDGAASMLDRAKATVSDGGKVRIEFDNSFALMIVDNDDVKKQIASALTSTGTVGEISYINIRMESRKDKEKKNSGDPLFDF